MNCLKAGSAKGKDILLLHGMSFQAQTWADLGTLEVLGMAGYDVTAVDMPGFGLSKKCGTGPDEVLLKLFEADSLKKPVMVGPSMGGRICINFALEHQEMVGGLVLVGSVGVDENRERIKTIRVPTLIVWGEKDHIAPISNAEFLNREINRLETACHPRKGSTRLTWTTRRCSTTRCWNLCGKFNGYVDSRAGGQDLSVQSDCEDRIQEFRRIGASRPARRVI